MDFEINLKAKFEERQIKSQLDELSKKGLDLKINLVFDTEKIKKDLEDNVFKDLTSKIKELQNQLNEMAKKTSSFGGTSSSSGGVSALTGKGVSSVKQTTVYGEPDEITGKRKETITTSVKSILDSQKTVEAVYSGLVQDEDSLIRKVETINTGLEERNKILKQTLDLQQKIKNTIELFSQLTNEEKSKLTDKLTLTGDTDENIDDLKKYQVELQNIQKELNNEIRQHETLEASRDRLIEKLELYGGENDKISEKTNVLIEKTKEIYNDENLTLEQKKLKLQDINKELQKEMSLIEKNKNLYDKITANIEKYQNRGEISSKQAKKFNEQLENINNTTDEIEKNKSLEKLNQDIVNTSKQTGFLGQSLGKAIVKYTTWLGIATVIAKIVRLAKDAMKQIEAMSSAMMELDKVTEVNTKTLNKFRNEAYKLAEQVGSTGLEIVKATTEFARMGYELKEAKYLGQAATVMTNIAENINSSSEAAQILISVMKGVKNESLSAIDILNKLNEISNNNAVGFKNLAEMAQTSSATMSILGNTFNQTLGMLTGAYEVLQDERVAKGIQTIGLRISGLNEDMESVNGLSNDIAKTLMKYADINIFGESGELKSTYLIFSELAEKWDKLSINVKSMILTTLAGKGRADVASALLSNWEAVDKAIQDADKNQKSAIEENQKYIESIDGLKKAIANTWQEISNQFINENTLKYLLYWLEQMLNIVNAIGITFADILTLVGGIGAIIGAVTGNLGLMVGSLATMVGGTLLLNLDHFLSKSKFELPSYDEWATNNGLNGTSSKSSEDSNYNKYVTYLETMKSAISGVVQEQKEKYELEQESTSEMEKQAQLQEKILATEKARAELERAKQERTLRVYRVGIGFVYESDEDEIEKAQENLEKAESDLQKYELQLDKEKYENFLNEINEILTSADATQGWEDLFKKYENIADDKYRTILKKTEGFISAFNSQLQEAKLIGKDFSGIITSSSTSSTTSSSSLSLDNLTNSVSGVLSTTSLQGLTDSVGSVSGQNYVVNLNGDLSFPNISNGQDADDFITAIIGIANRTIPSLN